MPDQAPEYFSRMCREFLGASGSLTRELWQGFVTLYPDKAHCMTYTLDKLKYATPPAPMEIVKQRLDHAAAMLTPQAFLEISGKLSPPGRPRRKDVVQFEEALLSHVAASGAWL